MTQYPGIGIAKPDTYTYSRNKSNEQLLGQLESWKDLYQVLLGIYLCQRWIVEFKGIMNPLLFMIFFKDFVTPQKRNMSEGCW